MYNALVMLYFNYCSAVWGDINIKKLADKLQKMQNRAARILTFSSYDVRSSVLLDDELGSEKLENVILKQLAVIMYQIHNDLSSCIWGESLPAPQIYTHNLRNSELNYYVSRPRTGSAKGSLHYRGSLLWNRIPSEIRKLPILNVLKLHFMGKIILLVIMQFFVFF